MNKLLLIQLNQIERVVCAAIRFEPCANLLALYQDVNEADLFAFAKKNRVESIVAHGLIKVLGAENTPAVWLEAHEKNSERISGYLSELDIVAELFAQKGVGLIVLKNGGIASGIFPCPGCVPMGDLDLLIEKKNFALAHQTLIDLGYTLCFRNPLIRSDLDSAIKEGGGEYWKILPNGEKLWVELQWRAVAGRWINQDQEPATLDLFARSQAITNTKVRLLCPEDNLLQVSLHTAKHSYVRAPGMRLHLDVDRIVNRCAIDWMRFTDTAIKTQIKTAVYFSLLIPKILFNTPVPDNVLQALCPGIIKARLIGQLIIRGGIFDPDKQKFSRLGYIFFNVLLYDNCRQLFHSIFFKARSFSQFYELMFKRINT